MVRDGFAALAGSLQLTCDLAAHLELSLALALASCRLSSAFQSVEIGLRLMLDVSPNLSVYLTLAAFVLFHSFFENLRLGINLRFAG